MSKRKETILIDSMHGFGDNIYQRPFVRKLVDVEPDKNIYINTSIPQIFSDIPNLKFLKPNVRWRTQNKNLNNIQNSIKWSAPPKSFDRVIEPHYGQAELEVDNLIVAMQKKFKVPFDSALMDLPPTPHHGVQIPEGKKLAVIRPVTIRNEWPCKARAPDPGYIRWCSRVLNDAGYISIAIADTAGGKEYAVAPLPQTDLGFWQGELGMMRTISLIQSADIVVTGSGWVVPACVASKTPVFIVFGGRGGYDSPWKILDPRMDLSKIGWAIPDKFCRCLNNNHNCSKKISNLDSDFYRFLGQIQTTTKASK